MPNESLTSAQVLKVLGENPKRIAEITSRLTPEQLHTTPGRDAWSANDVLAHLRCCADVWGGGLRTMLEQDRPTIRAVSPRGWVKRTNYPDLRFAQSLGAFIAQREELLAVLRPLTPQAWARSATIKASGGARTWTVLSYAERLAHHEHHHLEQFARIVDAIGIARRAR